MTVYQKRSNWRFLKWVLAGLVFILAMTITFDEVEGFNFPNKDRDNQVEYSTDNTSSSPGMIATNHDDDKNDPPSDIPEPTTLLLVASGLGAMYYRRLKQRKV